MRVIFSPSLYCTDCALYNLHLLDDTLNFIVEYLDAQLDIYDEAFYSGNNLFQPPVTYYNEYAQYCGIFTKLCKLMQQGDNVVLEHTNTAFTIENRNFQMINKFELQKIIDYIHWLLSKNLISEVIMFSDVMPEDCTNNSIEISVNGNQICIPIVADPWLDETGNFDNFIKENIKDYNSIFPCNELCCKIGNITMEIGNKALYNKYATIVANRNGYNKIPYSSRQYKNVPYFMRNDGEYIICVDTLHGLFEVFQKTGSTYEKYLGEYDFSCKKVSAKTSSSETHKCYNDY
jgi:hypothetical protein